MKEFIESYYLHLARHLVAGGDWQAETGWNQFLFYVLERSIPHLISSSAEVMNLQSVSDETDDIFVLGEGETENALLLFNASIASEGLEAELTAHSTIKFLLQEIQQELRNLKRRL